MQLLMIMHKMEMKKRKARWSLPLFLVIFICRQQRGKFFFIGCDIECFLIREDDESRFGARGLFDIAAEGIVNRNL